MTYNFPILTLLISISLCSCTDSTPVATAEDSRKLNDAGDIAAEIEKEHGIESHPYVKVDGVAQIELNVTDPKSDYESIIPAISKLKSVKSFKGDLHLVFRIHSGASGTGTVPDFAKFNAKTGQRMNP